VKEIAIPRLGGKGGGESGRQLPHALGVRHASDHRDAR